MIRLVTSRPQLGHLEEGSSFPSPLQDIVCPRSVLKMRDPCPEASLGSSATVTCYPPPLGHFSSGLPAAPTPD